MDFFFLHRCAMPPKHTIGVITSIIDIVTNISQQHWCPNKNKETMLRKGNSGEDDDFYYHYVSDERHKLYEFCSHKYLKYLPSRIIFQNLFWIVSEGIMIEYLRVCRFSLAALKGLAVNFSSWQFNLDSMRYTYKFHKFSGTFCKVILVHFTTEMHW